eukprot:gene11577-11721_t
MTASPRSSLDLSSRPQFPDGLRVLLLDTAAHASETAQLLLDQRYQPVIAEDVQHAVTLLNRQTDGTKNHLADAFDVILADLSLLSCSTDSRTVTESQDIWTAAKLVPIIIMGEAVAADDILQAINQGAADFIQKPLTQRCMRNIWQHTVRRLMGSATACNSGSCTPRSAWRSLQGKEQVCGQQLPSTVTAPSLPAGQHHLLHPKLHDCSPADVALAGLELPSLLPSQVSFDPDTIFQDLEGSPQLGAQEPSLDDLFCTGSKQCDGGRHLQPGLHPDKFVAADDLLSGGDTSEHDCSGSTMLRACGDCEAADISSAAGSGMAAPAERSSVDQPQELAILGGTPQHLVHPWQPLHHISDSWRHSWQCESGSMFGTSRGSSHCSAVFGQVSWLLDDAAFADDAGKSGLQGLVGGTIYC